MGRRECGGGVGGKGKVMCNGDSSLGWTRPLLPSSEPPQEHTDQQLLALFWMEDGHVMWARGSSTPLSETGTYGGSRPHSAGKGEHIGRGAVP